MYDFNNTLHYPVLSTSTTVKTQLCMNSDKTKLNLKNSHRFQFVDEIKTMTKQLMAIPREKYEDC